MNTNDVMTIILRARKAECKIDLALAEAEKMTQEHLLEICGKKLVIVDVVTLRNFMEGFKLFDKNCSGVSIEKKYID